MKKLIFPVFLLATACSSSREASHYTRKEKAMKWFHRLRSIAWSEDTVNSFRIAFLKDSTFYYTTERPGDHGQKIISGYKGRYRYSAEDTIYLLFKNKQQHPMCNYVIRAQGANYLIQYFTDNRPRIFMRKWYPYSHFPQ